MHHPNLCPHTGVVRPEYSGSPKGSPRALPHREISHHLRRTTWIDSRPIYLLTYLDKKQLDIFLNELWCTIVEFPNTISSFIMAQRLAYCPSLIEMNVNYFRLINHDQDPPPLQRTKLQRTTGRHTRTNRLQYLATGGPLSHTQLVFLHVKTKTLPLKIAHDPLTLRRMKPQETKWTTQRVESPGQRLHQLPFLHHPLHGAAYR